MKREITVSVRREGAWFVAQALDPDVASQGESVEAALANLREALELYFRAACPDGAYPASSARGRGCRRLDPCPFGRSHASSERPDLRKSASAEATSNSLVTRTKASVLQSFPVIVR